MNVIICFVYRTKKLQMGRISFLGLDTDFERIKIAFNLDEPMATYLEEIATSMCIEGKSNVFIVGNKNV